jgi:hypothetical protein
LGAAGVNGDFVEMAELVVARGARVNTPESDPALIAAFSREYESRISCFPAGGPERKIVKGSLRSILLGSDRGAACAEALLNHGADPKADRNVLHQAAGSGAAKVVEIPLAPRRHQCPGNHNTPLCSSPSDMG